jgi:hypothetical protein
MNQLKEVRIVAVVWNVQLLELKQFDEYANVEYITSIPSPNILLSTLPTNIINLCSSFKDRD